MGNTPFLSAPPLHGASTGARQRLLSSALTRHLISCTVGLCPGVRRSVDRRAAPARSRDPFRKRSRTGQPVGGN